MIIKYNSLIFKNSFSEDITVDRGPLPMFD